MRPRIGCALLLFVAGCASAPRPALLGELDAIRASASAQEARQLVPQADARAEKLRSDAELAWPEGHTASSEILAERALVAYADARELARIVRAEQRLLATRAELHQAEATLLKLQSDQKNAAGESADLEARLVVEREAEVVAESRPSTPDREAARAVAAKTALSQARLLCISAKLLRRSDPPPNSDIEAALKEVDTIEGRVATTKSPTPIREAIAARSRCQQLLTELRRPAILANPTTEQPDQLFVELAKGGFEPSRDERGIVVTLTDAFAGNALSTKVLPKLVELGRLAQKRDSAAILVVAHSKQGDPKPLDQQRAAAAAAKLSEAGVKQLEAQGVGGRLPVTHASDLGSNRRNERLELIFVTKL